MHISWFGFSSQLLGHVLLARSGCYQTAVPPRHLLLWAGSDHLQVQIRHSRMQQQGEEGLTPNRELPMELGTVQGARHSYLMVLF